MAYPDSILLIGTRAAQPAATAVAPGTLYSVTDESNLVEQSDGAVWTTYAGAGGGGGAIGMSAGTQSVSTGTVVFSNSNGITFGMSGSSRITASHDGLTSQSNQAASAANGSFAFQTLSFSNLNGISFGTSAGSAITASHNALTSQSNQALSGSNGSFTFQTATFGDLNGLTHYTSNGSLVGSYSVPVVSNAIQSVGSATGSGTNTSRFAADDHVHAGVFSVGVSTAGNTAGDTRVDVGRFVLQGGNNVTLSQITAANALNTIIISGPTVGGAQTGISGIQVSDTTYTSGTVTFQNANGISFGSSGANGISASYTRPVASNAIQSVGSATGSGTNTSRFAADDHVHAGVFSVGVSTAGNTAGDTRVDVGRFVFQGGNNVTLSQITAANALNTIVISGAAAGGAQTGISGIQVSDTTYTSGTVTFQNANGISFGSSGANGISASYTVPSTAGLLSNIRVSAGTTSNLLSAITFSNANGVSFGIDASTITASIAGLTSQSNQDVTAGNGGFAFQTLSFSDVNGISFGTSAGSAITASHNALTSQSNQTGGIYAVGNTTGQSSSSTYDARTLSVDGAGIVSVGWSNSTLRVSATQSNQAFSAAGGSSAFQTLGFSDNSNASFTNTNGSVAVASLRGSFYAVSNTTQSTSMTQNLNALSFHGAGVASVGVSNGSVIVSVPAGGGGITAINLSAGTTSNNLSAFTLSNSNNVSFGLNGSTVTASVGPILDGFHPFNGREVAPINVGNGTLQFGYFRVPTPFQFDRVGVVNIFTNASNSSGSQSISLYIGIYTRNESTLSRLNSASFSTAVTQSGTVGSYSLFGGIRQLTIGLTSTLTVGDYWYGVVARTSSGGANATWQAYCLSQFNSSIAGNWGAASNASIQLTLGVGVYSSSTTEAPVSVPFSSIVASGTAANRLPLLMFLSSTV